MFPPLAACAQANAGRLRRLRRGDEELKQKKIPAGTMLGSSSQKMSCANGCGMTWGKGANQCDDLNTRHIAPRCCKCVKQLIPGWNFDEWACVACMNRQREQQTPQAPPASATAASAGAASNEAAPLIQPCKTNTIRVGSTTTLDAHLERVYLRRSASCSSLRGDGHGRPWRC